jgi:hypothetical protein
MSYYYAYVKKISENSSIDNISFTPQKRRLIYHLIRLEKSSKGQEWFKLTNSNMLFHSSWLDNIVFINEFDHYHITHVSNGYTLIAEERCGTLYDLITKKEILTEYINMFIDLSTNDQNYWQGPLPFNFKTCSNCHDLCLDVCLRNDQYCYKCFNLFSVECMHCGNKFFNIEKKKYLIDNIHKYLCEECQKFLIVCSNCNQLLLRGVHEFQIVEDQIFCVNCFQKKHKSFYQCFICKTYFLDETLLIEKNSQKICNVCDFNRSIRGLKGGIDEYNYKPTPIYYGKDTLFFGTETEILTNYTRTEKFDDKIAKWLKYHINQIDDFCYIKYDRSIGREGFNGFEIVTHPFSWEWINSDNGIKKLELISKLKRFGCQSEQESSCGMHIHLSKDAFDNKTLYNFLYLIYNNKEFALKIAQRNNKNQIDRYANFESSQPYIETMAQLKANIDRNHYKAVNLNSPSTIEIRIFRSTLNINEYLKNLEYCLSTYIYSKEGNNLSHYLNYLNLNKNIYPHLTRFLNK